MQKRIERGKRFGVHGLDDPDYKLTADKQYYTCRHWDEDTRLCTIYDARPAMCKGYPYGKPCEHGCGEESADWPEGGTPRNVVRGYN